MIRKDFTNSPSHQIDHRIKNGLQLVNSLLSIQARSYKDLTIKESEVKKKNRIHAIKLIHDSIYYDGDVIDKVDISSYVESLLSFLQEILDDKELKVSFDISMNGLMLDMKVGVPLGLIINELMLNSINHAFVNVSNMKNVITLVLEKTNEKLIFKYWDNGCGFEKNNLNMSKSLGLEIIDLLSQQIKAELSQKTSGGVWYRFSI